MSEYQIVTFATTHRWKIYSELWKTLLGEESPKNVEAMSKMSFEERARRELLYTMDKPIRGTDDIFSNDQTKWFTNRYQLLDTDYIEPVSLGASISYDRLKELDRRKKGKTRENRPWSEVDSSLGFTLFNWSLSAGSKYNIYDKAQTKFTSSLAPPGLFQTNFAFGYTIDRSPVVNASNDLYYATTSERSVTIVTSLTNPVTSSWSYSRKDKVNDVPDKDYRQKLSFIYGSSTGCWGLGFAREKGYGVDESGAGYLLQLNMTFMGQTRELPNMSKPLEREFNKS
jgi:hypothetical protein